MPSKGRVQLVDDAIASYRQALDARADLTDVRYDLGVTFAARGSMADAVREFETIVQERPREPRFHNVLGMALLQMGRTDAALAAYKRGLEVAPDDAELRRNLNLAEAQRSRTSP